MDITIAQRVQNGIELLDAYGPEDWREAISAHDLDMVSTAYCILGQVYDTYWIGTQELRLAGDQYAQAYHGFELTHDEYQSEYRHGIAAQLRDEWIDQLSNI